MTKRAFSALALFLAVGCGDPPSGWVGGKADGFRLLKPLVPRQVSLDQDTHQAEFDDQYVAYEFSIDEPRAIHVEHRFSDLAAGWNTSLGQYRGPLGAALLLFKRDEAAFADGELAPEALWAAITPYRMQQGQTQTLQRKLHTPGVYMVIIAPKAFAYTDHLDSSTDIRTVDDPFDPHEPGRVHATVVDSSGRQATDLRVALGTAGGVTDSGGRVLLDNVEPGELVAKFGPQGSGRGVPATVHVFGSSAERGNPVQHVVFTVVADHYDAWRAATD